MSGAARFFRVFFMIVGLLFLAIGFIGGVADEPKGSVKTQWTCQMPQSQFDVQRCTGSGEGRTDSHYPQLFLLAGIGFQAAAVAAGVGSRQNQPVPFAPPAPAVPPGPPPWQQPQAAPPYPQSR